MRRIGHAFHQSNPGLKWLSDGQRLGGGSFLWREELCEHGITLCEISQVFEAGSGLVRASCITL